MIPMQHSLTQGPITKNILLFALPLMFGNLLQQMYNIADTWVVGRFLGADALAAVGSSYTLMTFLTSILLGLCMGSGAAVSMQYGSGETGKMRQSVFQSFLLIAGIALVLNLLVYLGLDGILWVLRVPAELCPLMKDYLLIIFLGIAATFLYNYFANLLRAIGNSVVPLAFLAVSAILNVILDLVCVLVLDWGVKGTAVATVFSQYVSGVGIGLYTLKKFPQLCPKRTDCRWDRKNLANILNLSVMTSVQQSIMNFGILMVQGLVNSFGTVIMAAFAAAVKIDSFAYMPVQDFGNAFSTYVAQNYGANRPDRIKKGIRSAGLTSAVFCIVISVLVCAFAAPLMGIFIDPAQTEIIAAGVLHRHWRALPALRLLPGGQPARDVGHPDHCFPWHPCGAGLSAFCHTAGRYRHLAQCAHRLGTGRCHRHWVLFEEENIKYPPLQSVLWHVCSGGYVFLLELEMIRMGFTPPRRGRSASSRGASGHLRCPCGWAPHPDGENRSAGR